MDESASRAAGGVGDSSNSRRSGDRLAILCATRPGHYFAIRALAGLLVGLLVLFAFDLLALVFGWIARSDIVSFLLIGPVSAEDKQILRDFSGGLPYDVTRLAAGLVALIVLILWQLAATRNLPPALDAARLSIREGPPWPGRWRASVGAIDSLKPWLIVVVSVGVMWQWTGWPSGRDWFYLPLVLGGAVLFVWCVVAAADHGGQALIQFLPAFVDVARSDVQRADREAADLDRVEAEQRWPSKPDLRLSAALRVMANPPPAPRSRRQRVRAVWWTGRDTTVEILATELVVQSLVEAHYRGLITITRWRNRTQRITATPPADQQPRGLAALVGGTHREGLTPARRVDHSLSLMLDEVAGADQHANVIALALDDLKSCGVATTSGSNGWRLSSERLGLVGSTIGFAFPPGAVADGNDVRSVVAHPTARLRRNVARHLKRKRTTEASSDNLLQMVSYFFVASRERAERDKYELPAKWPQTE